MIAYSTLTIGETEVTGSIKAVRSLAKIYDAVYESNLAFHVAESPEGDFSMGWVEGNDSLVVNINPIGVITQFWSSTAAYMVDTFTVPTDLSKIQKTIFKMIDSINATV